MSCDGVRSSGKQGLLENVGMDMDCLVFSGTAVEQPDWC